MNKTDKISKIKLSLTEMLYTLTLREVFDVVGGFDNFCKYMDIKSPRDFLNVYNNLNVLDCTMYSTWINLQYSDNRTLCIYDKRSKLAFFNKEISSTLMYKFDLTENQTKKYLSEWLFDIFNIDNATIDLN